MSQNPEKSGGEVKVVEKIVEVTKTVEVPQSIAPEALRGALARGYCDEVNENKTLDADLIESMALQVEAELKNPTTLPAPTEVPDPPEDPTPPTPDPEAPADNSTAPAQGGGDL